jgi:hypothetical protein
MPSGASQYGLKRISTNNKPPSIAASHTACRNTAAISPRRCAPLSCATVGGIAISTPTQTRITTVHSALPTPIAASVTGP